MIFVVLMVVAIAILSPSLIKREMKQYEEARSYAFGRRLISSLHERGLHDEAYALYRETCLNISFNPVSDQERRGIIEAYKQLYPKGLPNHV
jgi:hypothetical protein